MDKNFEHRRWPYILAWPSMQLIVFIVFLKKKILNIFGVSPKRNSLFFDGLGKTCKFVKDTAGAADSMHEIYNYPFKCGIISDFHQGCLNCQAVRNRFRLDKIIIGKLIEALPEKKEVKILSLASGTGQALIELMAKMPNRNIKALFVDRDNKSHDMALALAEQNFVVNKISFVVDDAFAVEKYYDFKPDIIEVIGLLEYLMDEEAIELIRKIRGIMVPCGKLVISSIRKNIETRFVTWVIDWPMVYREPKQLKNLLHAGGFVKVFIDKEPLNIHSIAVAE